VITAIRNCQKCGAKIFPDAPKGLCTACVLEAAIAASGDGGSAADAEMGGVTPTCDGRSRRALLRCWDD